MNVAEDAGSSRKEPLMGIAYAFRTAIAVFVLAGGARAGWPEAHPDQPGADSRLEQILNEWQRRSTARTNLDVRLNCASHDREAFEARVILLPKSQAALEYTYHHATSNQDIAIRWVWTGDSVNFIEPAHKIHYVCPLAEDERGRLPAVIALPFFWNLTASNLRSRYRVKLEKEDDQTLLLRFTPLTDAGRSWCSTAFVWLDRATYLPRRYYVVDADRKSVKDCRVTETHCDQRVADLDLRLPSGPGLPVSENTERPTDWLLRILTRLLMHDLL
jgi:outer membrane lipoprotein-sorting protein